MASIITAMISNALAAGPVEIWPTVDTSIAATIAEMGTASFTPPLCTSCTVDTDAVLAGAARASETMAVVTAEVAPLAASLIVSRIAGH